MITWRGKEKRIDDSEKEILRHCNNVTGRRDEKVDTKPSALKH